MPDIQITDQLGQQVDAVPVDLAHPSSLVKYLKSEILHFAVVPDFLDRREKLLTQAAPRPIKFEAKFGQGFQLGNSKPEINVTPAAQAVLRVNASPKSNLFDEDKFHLAAIVPDRTGYVSVGFEGSLELGFRGGNGDLTFGIDKTSRIALEYLKAFPLGATEPTLESALSRTLGCFVIPADLSDLGGLGVNDIATVSGSGNLKISGRVKIAASPNPLASVELPLGAGAVALKTRAVAGLSASFTISGSYQVRTRRIDADTLELSFLQERGTTLKVDVAASAGITAKIGDTDLIAALLDAISADPVHDKTLLNDLSPKEVETLSKAVKSGLDHSLQGSLDLVLSTMRDDQAAFQYEIKPSLLSAEGSAAVHQALDGDLSRLTRLENDEEPGGILAPGIKMLNSILSETHKQGATVKLNLLGILNYTSLAELIRHSEVLTDEASGDVTIKEAVTGKRINAIVDPMKRSEALRKAIFDSVLVTTCYRAAKAVAMPDLSCSQLHFTLNQKTNHQILGDYLNGFVGLNLLTPQDKAAILDKFIDGGPSTCVLRTSFDNDLCTAMFFDPQGGLHSTNEYLDMGRMAMRALLDPDHSPMDQLRYRIVDDLWPNALETFRTRSGRDLASLVGLDLDDPRVVYLSGDLIVITDWAKAMVRAGTLAREVRSYVGNKSPATLLQDNRFKKLRDTLQKELATLIAESKTRFDEPWGMLCLYWAAGSPKTAYGKAVTRSLTVERGLRKAIPATQQG